MKKSIFSCVILVILFLLFNVVAFAIPSIMTATFWVSYVFSLVMFVIEYLILNYSFIRINTAKEQFLSWPAICVGSIYFAVQTVLFLVFKIFSNIPVWIAVTTFTLLHGIVIISLLLAKGGESYINKIDEVNRGN